MTQTYYVLTALGPLDQVINLPETTGKYWRFRVNGTPVVISPHVKTFFWYHPLDKMYHVQELASGAFIAKGAAIAEASAKTAEVFKTVPEDKFFAGLASYGSIVRHPEISFDEAVLRMQAEQLRRKGPKTRTIDNMREK
jgi:hypothetical protein